MLHLWQRRQIHNGRFQSSHTRFCVYELPKSSGDELMKEFRTWRDIRDWAKQNKYVLLTARMELNNKCWNSSGEFGRSQVAICDALRFAEDEDERHAIASDIERELQSDELLKGIEK